MKQDRRGAVTVASAGPSTIIRRARGINKGKARSAAKEEQGQAAHGVDGNSAMEGQTSGAKV